MIKRAAIIRNKNGIHCRPSAVIMKAVEGYPGEIIVKAAGEEILLSSILNLLSLGLNFRTMVEIRVTGPAETIVCEKLVSLFELEFDFPPKDSTVTFNPDAMAARYKVYPVD